MNVQNINDLKLSGKGIIFNENINWLYDNVRIHSSSVVLHEVINSEHVRVGWICDGNLNFIVDMTVHTNEGMRGESISANLEYPLLIVHSINLIPSAELVDVDTLKTSEYLKRYLLLDKREVHFDLNENELLSVFSPSSDFLYMKSNNNDILIRSGGIMIMSNDKIFEISKEKGHISFGDNISINNGVIIVDGKEINPSEIIKNVSNTLKSIFINL